MICDEITEFCDAHNIQRVIGNPYTPEAQISVEESNRIIQNMVETCTEIREWPEQLRTIQAVMNERYNSFIANSPFYIASGREYNRIGPSSALRNDTREIES